MADIQSATAEIRRGKKKIERRNHRAKIFHRATIITVGACSAILATLHRITDVISQYLEVTIGLNIEQLYTN